MNDDILTKIQAGGVIKTYTLVNFGQLTNLYSLDFDGVDDYLTMGTPSAAVITGNMSASVWVKIDNFVDNASIISMSGSSESEADNYLYRITTDGGVGDLDIKVGHEYGSGSNEFHTFNTNLSLDTWYHLVVVRDIDAKTWKLYVDGALFGTDSYTNNATGGTSATLNLGVQGSNYFDGNIDEVSLWSVSLSAAQILAIYNNGIPTNIGGETGLVGWWRMGDGAVSPTIPDVSTNSNNGTMTNMVSGDIVRDVP